MACHGTQLSLHVDTEQSIVNLDLVPLPRENAFRNDPMMNMPSKNRATVYRAKVGAKAAATPETPTRKLLVNMTERRPILLT